MNYTSQILLTIIATLLFLSTLMLILSYTVSYTTKFTTFTLDDIHNMPDGTIFGCRLNGYMSEIVGMWTKSRYTHVGILCSNARGKYIFEVYKGVDTIRMSTIGDWSKRNNLVVRIYKGKNNLTNKILEETLLSNRTMKRSFNIATWTFLIFSKDISDKKSTYCSKFISSILYKANIISKIEDNITPGLLILSQNDDLSKSYYEPSEFNIRF